jgi:hypothetical protein
MSVTAVNESFEQRRSWRDAAGWHHARVYEVTCDNPDDGTNAAAKAAGLPVWNAAHPSGDGTRVQSINAAAVKGSELDFVTTVQYDVPQSDQGADNPLSRPAVISVQSNETTEEYFYDVNDDPVVNSMGFPFETVPTRDGSEFVIVVVRNQATRNIAADESYNRTVNDGNVTLDGQVFAAGTLKMSPIQSEKVFENGYTYYRYTYRIKANRDGWMQVFKDATFYLKEGGVAKEITVEDENGLPVAIRQPWPLDGAGSLKANLDDEPAEIEFEPYEPKNWGPLSFT